MKDRARKRYYYAEHKKVEDKKPSYNYTGPEKKRLEGRAAPREDFQLEHLQDVKTKNRIEYKAVIDKTKNQLHIEYKAVIDPKTGKPLSITIPGRPDRALDPANIYVTRGSPGGRAEKDTPHHEKYQRLPASILAQSAAGTTGSATTGTSQPARVPVSSQRRAKAPRGAGALVGAFEESRENQIQNLRNSAVERGEELARVSVQNYLLFGKFVIVRIDVAVGPPAVIAHPQLWAIEISHQEPILKDDGTPNWGMTERSALARKPPVLTAPLTKLSKEVPDFDIVRPKLSSFQLELLQIESVYKRYYPAIRPRLTDQPYFIRDKFGQYKTDRLGRMLVLTPQGRYEYVDRCTSNRL